MYLPPAFGYFPPISFKINRDPSQSTGHKPDQVLGKGGSQSPDPGESGQKGARWFWIVEALLVATCFLMYAGTPPPDVNESHYLTKAAHFWNRAWCPGDLFLGSAFSHWLFYVMFGWLTKFMSLTAFAWTGRVITCLLMGFAWHRLSHAIVPFRFMSVLSALFFLVLNERFHLAGEWVVGGFEAKGIAYALVIWALSYVVTGKWKFVWPLLGLASAFHVLVGGWAVLACFFCCGAGWIRRAGERSLDGEFWKDRLSENITGLLAGGAIALIGILPPILGDMDASRETVQRAHEIYVSQRISHHLDFGAFPIWHIARFALLCCLWAMLYVWLKKRLLLNPLIFHRKLEPMKDFAAGALVISFGGLLLSGLAERGNMFCQGLLRFYWFRLSDFAIPASVSLACCFVIVYWLEREKNVSRRLSCVLFVVCILLAGILMIRERHQPGIPYADLRSLPRHVDDDQHFRESWQNWVKVCHWIRDNTPENSVFITPCQQQTFKWHANRSEVYCWKDIPQEALGVVEWDRRYRRLHQVQQTSDLELLSFTDDVLLKIADDYAADYLVLPQRVYDVACGDPAVGKPRFTLVYPQEGVKASYVVLQFSEYDGNKAQRSAE